MLLCSVIWIGILRATEQRWLRWDDLRAALLPGHRVRAEHHVLLHRRHQDHGRQRRVHRRADPAHRGAAGRVRLQGTPPPRRARLRPDLAGRPGARAVQRAAHRRVQLGAACRGWRAATCLWATYLLTSRSLRQGRSVAAIMAAITPIASVVILPLGLFVFPGHAHRRSRGDPWSSSSSSAVLTGTVAHGLMVFAQQPRADRRDQHLAGVAAGAGRAVVGAVPGQHGRRASRSSAWPWSSSGSPMVTLQIARAIRTRSPATEHGELARRAERVVDRHRPENLIWVMPAEGVANAARRGGHRRGRAATRGRRVRCPTRRGRHRRRQRARPRGRSRAARRRCWSATSTASAPRGRMWAYAHERGDRRGAADKDHTDTELALATRAAGARRLATSRVLGGIGRPARPPARHAARAGSPVAGRLDGDLRVHRLRPRSRWCTVGRKVAS